MVSLNFNFDYKFRLQEKMDNLEEGCNEIFYEMVQEAKDNCISTRVADKISFEKTGRAKGVVRATHPASAAIEYGGKGYYPIVPKRANVLSWKSKDVRKNVKNGYAYTMSVDHPPMEMHPYIRPAMDNAKEKIKELIKYINETYK